MIRLLILLLVFIGLTACSSDSEMRYLDSRTTANLEIPPDLTKARLNEKFVIPANFSSALSETINEIPVLARVESIELAGSEDFYWLEFSGQIDDLYQTIKSFWLTEGYVLETDEPVIGVMQTKWIHKKEGAVDEDEGFIASLFGSGYLSESQDQFRTRIAIDSGSKNTRVYISHRGTEFNDKGNAKRSEIQERGEWSFRASEPELEIEMLSRLMVYLGVNQAEADQQAANASLFGPRASLHTDSSENETYILVRSIKELAWNRLMHELDRLDFEIVSSDPSRGLSGDGVLFVNTQYISEQETKQVALIVSEESNNITRIGIETPDGDNDDSTEAIEFLTMLFERIR